MRIAVVGLGYVGAVTSACFADSGNEVIGVDINAVKVAQINAGAAPIIEPGLDEIVSRNLNAGRLRATTHLEEAVSACEFTVVCVGTPSTPTGDTRLTEFRAVLGEIGDALKTKHGWHLVVITSTVPPGTVSEIAAEILSSRSGRSVGTDFGLAFSPEFLRETTAVFDFMTPEKTVIGVEDQQSRISASKLYAEFATNLIFTSIRTAEMVKFTDNAWHALKVSFANEIGRFCSANGIDSLEVMDVFKADRRLNISPAYLTPGFAFGGSCLPKDLRTLTYRGRSKGVSTPILDAVLPSNRAHVDAAVSRIQALPGRSIALLGIAFKPGTDDLRESPLLELAEQLLGKGYSVVVHDRSVSPSRLIGANRDYVLRALPHIAEMLREDLDEVIAGADVIIVGHTDPSYADVASRTRPGTMILDLTGVARPDRPSENYVGFLW